MVEIVEEKDSNEDTRRFVDSKHSNQLKFTFESYKNYQKS